MPVDDRFVVETVDTKRWDKLIRQFRDANYRQLAGYSAAAARRIKGNSENVAIHLNGSLVGLCNVRIRTLPFFSFGIAYVNGGPLILKDAAIDVASVMRHCLTALVNEYSTKRGHVLRIVGVARADCDPVEVDTCFRECSFRPSSAKGHYRTMLLDIGRDLAEIRKGFDQKWRNVLNKAERQELEIIRGTGNELFAEFDCLFRGLVERKQFSVDMGPEFFAGLQGGLDETNRFVVHLARQGGRAIAGHIGAYHGDTAVYLLGAANEDGLKANASYLLQWRVIEYAKQRGCCWYDLGGIDPATNPDVYRFKMRMGGRDISAPGPYESGSPARSSLIGHIETIYRRVRK